jgi:hypothetical protein
MEEGKRGRQARTPSLIVRGHSSLLPLQRVALAWHHPTPTSELRSPSLSMEPTSSSSLWWLCSSSSATELLLQS